MAGKRQKTKRTLSPEQLAKMQEGKRKAQEQRDKEAKERERYRERVEMLSELEHDLAEGRRQSKSERVPRRRYRRGK